MLNEAIPLGDDKHCDRDDRYRRLADHHVTHVLHDLGIQHEPLFAHAHDAALERAAEFTVNRLSNTAGTR